MKQIKSLSKWLKGKTITKVNDKNINCLIISFEDGSALWLETECVDSGLMAYGPVGYETSVETLKKMYAKEKALKKEKENIK